MINDEGGAIPEEYRVEYVVDRVEHDGHGLARPDDRLRRCHDHKYDPHRRKDFTSFFAFFNSTFPRKGWTGLQGECGAVSAASEQPAERLDALMAAIKKHTRPNCGREMVWEQHQCEMRGGGCEPSGWVPCTLPMDALADGLSPTTTARWWPEKLCTTRAGQARRAGLHRETQVSFSR